MAQGSFPCPKCGRKFVMAAHLARHMNAGHGSGAGRPSAAKSKPKAGRRGRPQGSFGSAAGSGAGRFISEMQTYHNELMAQRSTLDGQIDAISSALAALGSSNSRPTGARKGRPARAARASRGVGAAAGGRRMPGTSLREYIVRVLKATSAPLAVKDIASQVVRVGYKTNSKDLTKAVSNMLPQIKEVRKVDRGLYKA